MNKHDRRIFTPTPHGSPSWRRGYNRRRLWNGSLTGFELHFLRGQAKMQARLALAVMMALALGSVLEGCPGRMGSPTPDTAYPPSVPCRTGHGAGGRPCSVGP